MLLFIRTYCTVLRLHADTYASYLDKLVKISNKILRILLNQSARTPVPQLYEMFGLLSIGKLYSFQVLLLVFKCIHCSHLLCILAVL